MQNEKKCYNCGKEFRNPAEYKRHKDRKTPCIIREVAPEHINNPNRCIYCNKIFANVGNKNKHFKKCKIKNGGMDMLVDKVKYEQEIRILKEQCENNKQERENDKQQMDIMMGEINILKQAMVNVVPQTVNNINNVNYNAPVINVVVNNYSKPCLDKLHITLEDLLKNIDLPRQLLQLIYFNPDIPENHCIYLKNKKDRSLIVFDDSGWRSVTGDNIDGVITMLNNAIYSANYELINTKRGPYEGKDSLFEKLPGAIQNKIFEANKHKGCVLSHDDAYEVFLGGRDIVLNTIKAAGCKLV